MTLGMSTAAYYGEMETEDAARQLADLPLDTCEVFLETYSEYTEDFGKLVRDKLGSLPCISVHPKGTQFESDLFGKSARQVREAMDVFRGVCRAARALGAAYYVFHGPGVVRGRMHPDRIYKGRENIRRLWETAGEYNLEILWENVSWRTLQTPEDVAVIRECYPYIRFVLDTKQAYQSGADLSEMVHEMGDHLCHVHVLGWTQDGRLALPGMDNVDWNGFGEALSKARFQGSVILEPYGGMCGNVKNVLQSLETLRTAVVNWPGK